LVPVAMFFSAAHQVMEQWLIRCGQFKVSAKVSVMQSVLVNVSKASFGLFLPLASVLIVLQSVSYGLHALLLWFGLRHRKVKGSTGSTSIRVVAIKYWEFPAFRAPQIALNAFAEGLPVL